MRARAALGAVGVAAMGLGASLLLTDSQVRAPLDVPLWMAGAIVLHDAVLAPVVLAIGAALAHRLPPRVRRPVRAGLIVAACLTAVALPVLLRPGATSNPSVLPLDYPRNTLIALGAVAVVTALAAGWAALRRFRSVRKTLMLNTTSRH
ncbi:hypothetical protein QMK19_19020 [Streptomyces sp. H10-C2]|uniref:hypothetical protein n=1 Tax=unclassified Streptomyces TaxID=2593676 RepID=UPI0024BAFF87|nr:MULTISPECIES: hypothetical protein [unclassified Streptomyces]MDJ0340873.1 hypothetical protein [Streptomyces sp. PH10-H1]MDJ0371713.1 hypothetical protein [Streptomyces sp. H10-C2]